MGVLKYAILGLLHQKSMTGYEITKEFETTLLQSWRAKHSQIYPKLKSLTEKYLVKYEVQISGNVLEKKVYSLTEKGEKDFLNWASKLDEIKPSEKSEFKLKLFFSYCIKPQERIAILKHQHTQHSYRLLKLKNDLQKFSDIPPTDEKEFSDYLVLLGAIMNEESICNWLETSIKLCKERENKI